MSVLVAMSAVSNAQDVLRISVHRINDRFQVISGYANGNILVVHDGDSLVLIDAQSAKRVGQADSALRALSAKPVRLVVNTHYHGDHTEGNAYFRQKGATVLAHRNVPVQAAKDTTVATWNNWHRTPLASEAMPTTTFSDSLPLRVAGDNAWLLHIPNAHTDGDAIVWFPRSNVIHVGDLVELGAYPFIDWWTGGSLDGMLRAVDRILSLVNDSTAIVPGHGPVSDRRTVLAYRAMLVAVRDRVARAVAEGKALPEVVQSKPTAEFDATYGGECGGRRFAELVYVGLSERARSTKRAERE